MKYYLHLTSKPKFELLCRVAESRGMTICEEYKNNFEEYPYMALAEDRNAEYWSNDIVGYMNNSSDDNKNISFEDMLDLILDYKKTTDIYLSNTLSAKYREGDGYVTIGNETVDVVKIRELFKIINN